MTALFASLLGLGLVLLVVAAVWAVRTRHERRLWRQTRHDTAKVAIVLELEEHVRELESLDLRADDAVDVR
jgi:hypothetical protein